MKFTHALGAACVATACAMTPLQQAIAAELQRPNIVTIVIDDMGYSDIIPYGGEVHTPELQRLAQEGVVFSDFYAAPTSTPSRAMFFTGKDPHKVGVGTMSGWARPAQSEYPGGPQQPLEPMTEYAGRLQQGVVIFPEVLQRSGYHTMMSGKWDMSGDEDDKQEDPAYLPNNRGFDQTFVLIPGGDGSWMQYRRKKYNQNGQPYDDFKPGDYSTTVFTDKALEMMEKRDKNKPFYLNVAYTAPHAPILAPAEVIAKYEAVYAKGWDKIREERLARQKASGLISADAQLGPRPETVPAWDSLTPEEQKYQAKIMATYAAMIDVLDQNLARITNYLKQNGLYDNTVFLIYSDNGAAPGQSGSEQFIANIDACVDNSYANLGSPTSFPAPSPGWGMASNSPFHHFKADTYDGGVRVPALISYPHSKLAGVIDHSIRSAMDIAPTILELAGATYPYSYQGKPNSPMEGESMAGLFKGKLDANPDRWLAWELDGLKGVRKGDWKLSQHWIFSEGRAEEEWHLYNVADDFAESKDMIAQNPDKFAELLEIYWDYARENKIVEFGGRVMLSNLGVQLHDASGTYPLDNALAVGGSRRTTRNPDPTVVVPSSAFLNRTPNTGLYQAGVDPVEIEAELTLPPEHVGRPADVFVEAAYTTADGAPAGRFGLNQDGQWAPVGAPGTGPAYMNMPLPSRLPVPIWPNYPIPLTGKIDVTFGYRFMDGTSVTNATPLRVTLAETLPHGPTGSPQACKAFPWLK